MGKQRVTGELVLPPRERGSQAARWLYGALRDAILEGRLGPGARLPATRDMARTYGLSRGTIVRAFEQLHSEGYVEARVGSGTYVTMVLPDRLLEPKRLSRERAGARERSARRVSGYARQSRVMPPLSWSGSRAFRTNLPALDQFPTTVWAQIASRRIRSASAALLAGCEPLGHRPLREAIAEHLRTARGVVCDVDQVAIVSGVQEALDLTARLLLERGDVVAVEDPGYVGARRLFEAYSASISSVAVDDEGLSVNATALRNARLVYVTPAHQFPLGVGMSLARRLALLEWAAGSGGVIFEDDYDAEYRYSGQPLPSLQGLDRHGQVVFAGSFSKVLFPALRLGYMVVPPDLTDAMAAALSLTTRHAPLLDQAVLADFITDGHFGRHLRRMRQVYAERLSILIEAAAEHLDGLLELSTIEAGLHTVGWLPAGARGEAAAAAAAERNVHVTPLSRYAPNPLARDGLVLGFAAVDPRRIRRAVRDLAAALHEGVAG